MQDYLSLNDNKLILGSKNSDIAQVKVSYQTTWSSPVAPLETTGTQDDRLTRSFLNPDSNVSGISINGMNVSKTGPLIYKHQLTHNRSYQCRATHQIFKYTLSFLHKLGYPTRTWCYWFVLPFPLPSHSPPYNVHLRRSYLSHTSPTATRWNNHQRTTT